MILDNALSKSLMLDDKLKKMLNYVKPSTRRYVFGPDASHKQGRIGTNEMDIVCRNAAYMVKPYPNTYVEVDFHALIRGKGEVLADDAAEKIGFWWTQFGHCFVIVGDEARAEFTPFVYARHGERDGDKLFELYREEIDEGQDVTHLKYDAFKAILMLGKHAATTTSHMLTDLYEIGMTRDELPQSFLSTALVETAGSYKYGVTALMLLDERSKRKLVPVAATRKIVKGKLKAVPAHHMVTIDLDVPYIRNVYADPIGHRESPMEHDVSEHWVVYDASSQCKHNWQPFYSEDAAKRDMKAGHDKPLRREYCTLCGGRRTRKPNYVSGDPKKGTTVGTKSYRVIASREKGK